MANSSIDDILNNPSTSEDDYNMAQRVSRLQNDIIDNGLTPPPDAPRESLVKKLLDGISAPMHGVAGVVDALAKGDIFGQDYSGDSVGTGFLRGIKNETSTSDLLQNAGVENPIALGVGGFLGDVALDPTTYLSFGTSTAAKAGARTLTEAGSALRNQVADKLTNFGITDVVEHGEHVDDIFSAISNYQKTAKILDKTAEGDNRAALLSKMSDLEQTFSPFVSTTEAAKPNLFEVPSIKVGGTFPFLGHIAPDTSVAKTATELLDKDPGPVGQVLRSLGEVWKPGRVNLIDAPIPEAVTNAYAAIADTANASLSKIMSAAAATPIIGPNIEKLTTLYKAGSSLFSDIFRQKAVVGEGVHAATVDFKQAKFAAKAQAIERTVDALGENILGNKDIQKEITLAMDAQAMEAVKASIKPGSEDAYLKIANSITDGEMDPAISSTLFNGAVDTNRANLEFAARLENLRKSALSPDMKDGIERAMGLMNSLAQEEADAGIKTGYLDFYLPRRYKALAENAGIGGGAATGFTKSRKYASLSDAFLGGGHVAETGLGDLIKSRVEGSITLQAQKRYFNRVAVESGLPQPTVTRLFKEAAQDPAGEAAALLKQHRFNFKPLSASASDSLMQGEANAAKQAIYNKVGAGDALANEAVYNAGGDLSSSMRHQLFQSGIKPLDTNVPNALLAEIGDVIKSPSGEETFVPSAVARAYKETVAARDILKSSSFGQSPFGKASIALSDSASNMFRKWNTLPWAAHWFGNLLGDRFNGILAGVAAHEPGIPARMYSVMNGKSAIKAAAGTIDKAALERIYKSAGIKYSSNEALGTIKSFADMDIESYLATKNNSFLENNNQ